MKGVERWVSCADNHGNQADHTAVAAFLDFVRHFKPTVRIHKGDNWNFAALRRNATDQERREKLADDIEAGSAFIKAYKPTAFIRGNHDERIYDAARSDDGKLSDFAAYAILDMEDAIGTIPHLPYDKRRGVYPYGNFRFIHGYHTGLYAARHAAAVYGNVCMGHVHANDHFSLPQLDRVTGYTSGCLCKLDQDYNRGHPATLRQSHGFLYGLKFPNGRLQVWPAESIDGKWYLPSEIREVAHAK